MIFKQTLAVLAAAAVGLLTASQAAVAQIRTMPCVARPTTAIAVRSVSPCSDQTIPRHRAITFVVTDSSPQATDQHPYLDVQTSSRAVDGHLVAQVDGTGVFARMQPVRGDRDQWTLTVPAESFSSWWDNRRGTVYVQVDQLDTTASATDGIAYSPIVALHVG